MAAKTKMNIIFPVNKLGAGDQMLHLLQSSAEKDKKGDAAFIARHKKKMEDP